MFIGGAEAPPTPGQEVMDCAQSQGGTMNQGYSSHMERPGNTGFTAAQIR